MKLLVKSLVLATLAGCAVPAVAAPVVYTSRAAFNAAAGGGLVNQDFNGAPTAQTSTSVTYGALNFSCTASQYCPGFFGTRSLGNGGSGSVYFATPSSAIFSFVGGAFAFGVDVLDVGTNGATNFTAVVNGVTFTLQSNYSSGTAFFFGVIDSNAFANVTFSGSQADDGIDFDDASYSLRAVAPGVPEPATWAMLMLGFGAMGYSLRRRGVGYRRQLV